MFGDFFTDISDYFKSRLSNPFLSTLIVVWLIRNWVLVYSIFTFDDDCTWNEKVAFIENYFNKRDLCFEIWTNLWITLTIMVSGFILMALTRWITNLYDFRILPLTYKYSDNKKLITEERYTALFDLSIAKDNTIENLRNRNASQEITIRGKDDDILKLTAKISELQSSLLKFSETDGDGHEAIFDYSIIENLAIDETIKTEVTKAIQNLIERNLLDQFNEIYRIIDRGPISSVDKSLFMPLLKLGLFNTLQPVYTSNNLEISSEDIYSTKIGNGVKKALDYGSTLNL